MKLKALFVALSAAAFGLSPAENPHDGYMFWMPNGELVPGRPDTWKAFDYAKTDSGERFTIKPRRTRFDAPRQQIVIVQSGKWLVDDIGKPKTPPRISVDGKPLGPVGPVVFLPTDWSSNPKPVTVEVEIPKNVKRSPGFSYRFFATDDADKLGKPLAGDMGNLSPTDPLKSYKQGLVLLFSGQPQLAAEILRKSASNQAKPDVARLYRRLARWAEGETAYKRIKTGPGFYRLGQYAMVIGAYDLAEKSFKKATEIMPANADAWYMYADALSYKSSDLGDEMERIAPYYRKAADLYPRENSNTFRTFFGLFRNLRVRDGNGTRVIHMTDEQIEHVKKNWEWCSAIMESASRGSLRMVNTYKIIDEEYDSTNDWDPRPFMGIIQPGTTETFIKMTGWGASDCCGMDTGPDRSAFINLGIREWDVMLHEWNHSLDWAMIADELGIGVPETHSSDWCGFQPISSMGMGHHSCNRYYMTPGMYRIVRGTDPITTKHVDVWQVSGPYILQADIADPKKIDEAYAKGLAEKLAALDYRTAGKPFVLARATNGYVDLKALWPESNQNSSAFAKTYIYSPKDQKVRMWLGFDSNARIWLNGKMVYKGIYWSTCQFYGRKMVDQVAAALNLKKGWNEFIMQVTGRQQGPDWQTGEQLAGTWGFSVRFCDIKNQEVPGLVWQATKPEGFTVPTDPAFNPRNPKTFKWSEVADDYTTLLPQLTIEDLRSLTGYPYLTATNEVLFGFSPIPKGGLPYPWMVNASDPKSIRLDNQLNWFFSPKELCATLRYRRDGKQRDLLFIRPEGYEAFLSLLPVFREAEKLGIKSHSNQIIGYFTVPRPDSPHGRIMLVVDTALPEKLPTDEEDLLSIKSLK